MKSYTIKITFTETLLGAVPKSKQVYTDHFLPKADLTEDAEAEELETVPQLEEKGATGFHTVDDQPVLYNYVVKGFFKDACGMLRRIRGSNSAKIRAYKKEIDGLVFVQPRHIPLMLPQGQELDVLERPLRATGPQGDRVALARSDTCPPGTTMRFTVTILGGSINEELLTDWLGYGQLRGFGQWRNAGFGQFIYTLEPSDMVTVTGCASKGKPRQRQPSKGWAGNRVEPLGSARA